MHTIEQRRIFVGSILYLQFVVLRVFLLQFATSKFVCVFAGEQNSVAEDVVPCVAGRSDIFRKVPQPAFFIYNKITAAGIA